MELYNILKINGIDMYQLVTLDAVKEDLKKPTKYDSIYMRIESLGGGSGVDIDFDSRTSTKITSTTTTFVSGNNMTYSSFYIAFYKNTNNKIVGITIVSSSSFGQDERTFPTSNNNNRMTYYRLCDFINTSWQINNVAFKFNVNGEYLSDITCPTGYGKWNYVSMLFDDDYSDDIINLFVDESFKQTVINNATNSDEYIRRTDYPNITDISDPKVVNVDLPSHTKSSYLSEQINNALANQYFNTDYNNMSNLNNWIDYKQGDINNSISSIYSSISSLYSSKSSIYSSISSLYSSKSSIYSSLSSLSRLISYSYNLQQFYNYTYFLNYATYSKQYYVKIQSAKISGKFYIMF